MDNLASNAVGIVFVSLWILFCIYRFLIRVEERTIISTVD